MRTILVIAVMTILAVPAFAVDVATLEDIALAPESFYNGGDSAGGFTSGGFFFENLYDTLWGSWEDFAVSNVTDNTTPGWSNQYSAIPGSGVDGSSNYAMGYLGYAGLPNIDFSATELDGMFITNATYAYLSMRDGDGFAKKFGGVSGTDEDWFLLTITGMLAGSTVGTVDFYLADFRFADSAEDYIISDWTWVDLSGLGIVDSLEFDMASTDNGTYGMNTPSYFAVDNVVPEPATMSVLSLGGLALLRRRRSKQAK